MSRSSNSNVVAGRFCGAEIEPGTFHGAEIEPGTFHGAEIEPGTFHRRPASGRSERPADPSGAADADPLNWARDRSDPHALSARPA